jgi:beta-galactosidase/beta-glucuronidase
MTTWGENIDVNNVWNEYPRPIMERTQWVNLNGLWDYAITDALQKDAPATFDGEILVPFCVESALSGVGKSVSAAQELWYQRKFTLPKNWNKDNILLNFGAVDWKCDVWVNGTKVGSHSGGYAPFSIDITNAVARKGENTLTVCVWDPTDKGYQPRGKQMIKQKTIWYTPVTGIWQTVWLEPVSAAHISSLRILPDIDKRNLSVAASTTSGSSALTLEVKVYDDTTLVASATGAGKVDIAMPADMKLWSPDSHALYDLEVALYDGKKKVDTVKSYAAMRKFSMARDEAGFYRLQLNNKDLFQFGPLDQGWWPDGLYTPPSYEAMIYDLVKTKELGFNMIRKHIKVEPATWYTYCDRNGIIVWQDMPSGDSNPEWQKYTYFTGADIQRTAQSELNYRKEWEEIIDCLYSYPCISTWTPFNEAWGQFKTKEIAAWTKELDPSRLVNPASGGNYYRTGDILDLHKYPAPDMFLFDPDRANVIGEYGGIGYAVTGHLWAPDRNWGYIKFKSTDEVTDTYVDYAEQLYNFVEKGVTAGVYTQTTDVEIEINGFMTYDRKVMKMDEKRVRDINTKLVNSLNK